jgi:hypothetical protein
MASEQGRGGFSSLSLMASRGFAIGMRIHKQFLQNHVWTKLYTVVSRLIPGVQIVCTY